MMLEHKGLYWSKVPGTEEAKTIEPSKDYILPLGKANIVLQADEEKIRMEKRVCIITYGMGVYWAKAAAKNFEGKLKLLICEHLFPLDEAIDFFFCKKTWKVFGVD